MYVCMYVILHVCVCVCVCVCMCVCVCVCVVCVCVCVCETRFEKSQLPCTQQLARHTFHHQTIPLHIDQPFRQVLMLKVAQVTCAVACF